MESILPGRYNGYDLIHRYKLLEKGLDDHEFHARVIAALERYKETKVAFGRPPRKKTIRCVGDGRVYDKHRYGKDKICKVCGTAKRRR